jgi:hypothetical protein
MTVSITSLTLRGARWRFRSADGYCSPRQILRVNVRTWACSPVGILMLVVRFGDCSRVRNAKQSGHRGTKERNGEETGNDA